MDIMEQWVKDSTIPFKQAIELRKARLLSAGEMRQFALKEIAQLDFEWYSADTMEELNDIERCINFAKLYLNDKRSIKPYTGSSIEVR